MQLTWLDDPNTPLPPTTRAWGAGTPAPGLLAAGGVPHPERLEEAYARGVFPWYGPGEPVMWWSPNPRMVLVPQEFRLHRSLRQVLRRWVRDTACEIRVDSDFSAVIRACAQTPREGQTGTWIVPEMIEAYTLWHRMGRVHSFEAWQQDRLLGGLYGVAMGRMFFGESMFSHATDGSKIALAALVAFAREHGIGLIDCQQRTAHLASMGAREMPRPEFEAHLQALRTATEIIDWTYHPRHWAHLLGSTSQGAPGQDDCP
jgi:leucyl/phenylalanyl-tRNA--protein transferase